MKLSKLVNDKMNRRRVLGNLGLMGLGAVVASCTPRGIAQPRNLDAAILNFALNLEYLEAAFYLAAVGRLGELPGGNAAVRLPAGFTPLFPPRGPIAGAPATENNIAEFAQELAEHELAHVVFLRNALAAAGAPVAARPVIDLDASFKAAAAAAFSFFPAGKTAQDAGLPAGFTPDDFDPFANSTLFLHGTFIFEDVGVTAYHGAAEFLTNKDFLRAAAGILAVEAYHSGAVRKVLYDGSRLRRNDFGGIDTWAITEAISKARNSLNPGVDNDQGIVGNRNYLNTLAHESPQPEFLASNIVPVDGNAITFPRTPRQVANIVFLNPNTQPGGFFPNGISIPAGLENDFNFLLSL